MEVQLLAGDMDMFCPSAGLTGIIVAPLSGARISELSWVRVVVHGWHSSTYNIVLYFLVKLLSLRERSGVPMNFSLLKLVVISEILILAPFAAWC